MHGTRPGRLFALLSPILACLALASCSRGAPILVALDEAFVAARPELAAGLSKLRALGRRTVFIQPGLGEGPGRVLVEMDRLGSGGERPAALIASPYLAAGLCDEKGPISSLGQTALIAVEWPRPALEGLSEIRTLATPAYEAAGRASGSFIAALAASGGKLACGVVYLESPARPSEALEAFSRAFREASNGAALLVRKLEGGRAKDEDGDLRQQAETAVTGLLESDVRVIFIAAGQATATALAAAARPGIALGADQGGLLPLTGLAFRIRPDEAALAREAARMALRARESSPGRAEVPSILETEPGAKALKAGGRGLDYFIARARGENGR